jgi:hypothetical protein
MKTVRLGSRLTIALSSLAFAIWCDSASADIKVTSGSSPAGPGKNVATAGGTISLGDDSGKKGGTSSSTLVPPTHTVKKGDTLWDICDSYYSNPWQWPRVWSYNPEILNPHWIYPGEIVRLKKDGGGTLTPTGTGNGNNAGSGSPKSGPGAINASKPLPGTVFLRNIGFVYDKDVKQNGVIIGSPEDKMLLSTPDRVYIQLGSEQAKNAQPGDEMTIYQTTRAIKTKGGSTVGDVVEILGTVKLDKVDKDKGLAEGRINESLDVIERDALVGPVDRKLDVVAPTTNDVEIEGELLASVRPNVMFAQNQVVLIDKGANAGLKIGNRLFVLAKGDPWAQAVGNAGALATGKVTLGTDTVEFKSGSKGSESADYPDEVIAEIRILRVRKETATAIVTQSKKELSPGDRWKAKKGY